MESAQKFFSEQEQEELVKTIKDLELKTTAEMRIHPENYCLSEPLNRAAELFEELGMSETAEKNGVLLYIAVKDHKFAIIGDSGIDQKVSNDFWQNVAHELTEAFKRNDFFGGTRSAISQVGKELSRFYPYQKGDENELPDELSFS